MSSATPVVIVHYTLADRPLTPDEITGELRKLGRRDLAARAIRQLLQQRLAAATIEASAARLTEREAGHAGGRLEELIGLAAEFDDLLGPAQG